MIGQFLSQTNEIATIPILQNFLELNKAFAAKKKPRFVVVGRTSPAAGAVGWTGPVTSDDCRMQRRSTQNLKNFEVTLRHIYKGLNINKK